MLVFRHMELIFTPQPFGFVLEKLLRVVFHSMGVGRIFGWRRKRFFHSRETKSGEISLYPLETMKTNFFFAENVKGKYQFSKYRGDLVSPSNAHILFQSVLARSRFVPTGFEFRTFSHHIY